MSTPEDDDKRELLLKAADKLTEFAKQYSDPDDREYGHGMRDAAGQLRYWAANLSAVTK